MATVSAKFGSDEDRKLNEICEALHIDKSEALRRATNQLWLALQIDKPFVDRAGGRPEFLLESGKSDASSRLRRKREVSEHLQERARRRKRKPEGGQ